MDFVYGLCGVALFVAFLLLLGGPAGNRQISAEEITRGMRVRGIPGTVTGTSVSVSRDRVVVYTNSPLRGTIHFFSRRQTVWVR